jgi:multidrug resistance efflux pump
MQGMSGYARLLLIVILLGAVAAPRAESRTPPSPPAASSNTSSPTSSTGSIRLSGTVEAVRSTTVMVPRLAGQNTPTLVITSLVKPGTHVKPGDFLVAFDPQDQERAARDSQAQVDDLDSQIMKKESDQLVARASDETALQIASRDIERAKLDILKNDFVPRVEAEKNNLALEQAQAKCTQLQVTDALKRKSEAADLKVLQIQSERADKARQYAEDNAKLMLVKAPFEGMVVLRTVYTGTTMAEVQEGQELRPGVPILDIIDATSMQVRAKVNQADFPHVKVGDAVKVRLDAYPALIFDGRLSSIAPIGVTSSLSNDVRTFTALVAILGTSPQLMPDLTASVEIPAHGGRP